MGHQNIFTPHKKDNIIFLPLANRTTQFYPFLMGHQKLSPSTFTFSIQINVLQFLPFLRDFPTFS